MTMKRRHVYISILLLFVMTVTSCGKNFLEEEPSTSVSVDNAILTEGDMMEALAGLYRILDNYYLYGRNALVWGDLLADNVYISSSNSSRLLPWNSYTYVAGNAEASLLWSQN